MDKTTKDCREKLREHIKKAVEDERVEYVHCNDTDFVLVAELDGRISIFSQVDGIYRFHAQASNTGMALDYIELLEPAPIPLERIGE